MLKKLKNSIILSYIFWVGCLIFLLILVPILVSISNSSTQPESYIAKIVVLYIGLVALSITFLVFMIKSIVLTHKLKYDTEFILMVIGVLVPLAYLIGSIMVLCKNEENITNSNNNDKFINKY